MWRAVIIVIEVVLLVMLLRTDFAQALLRDAKVTVIGWYEAILHVPDQQQLNGIRDGFLYSNLALQEHQTDYVMQLTESKSNIVEFHIRYCKGNDVNPFLYGVNLRNFCAEINKTSLVEQ